MSNKNILFIISFFLLLWTLSSTYNKFAGTESAKENEYGLSDNFNGQQMPEADLIEVISGNKITLKPDPQNQKNSLFLFMTSWCSSCLKEHKALVATKGAIKTNLYAIIPESEADSILDFIRKYDNPYDAIYIDKTMSLTSFFTVKQIPFNVLVDKSFTVIGTKRGIIPLNSIK